MANYNFRQDLVIGEKGEEAIVSDLGKFGVKLIEFNKDNRYDLLMEKDGVEVKYEVKTDVFCKPTNDTGNIFVEYECRGKNSGILVTEAKWFVTYFKHLNEIWYIKTDTLKNLIEKSHFRETQFSGDNGSNTKGYLVPRKSLKEHFIVRQYGQD